MKNLDFAYIAAELGKNLLAPEAMNCVAPDTGNIEVLERVGTQEEKAKWLKPLLNGEIRSAYATTEPNVASTEHGVAGRGTARFDLVQDALFFRLAPCQPQSGASLRWLPGNRSLGLLSMVESRLRHSLVSVSRYVNRSWKSHKE